jgi:thiol:disulfide interchange protein DsbD
MKRTLLALSLLLLVPAFALAGPSDDDPTEVFDAIGSEPEGTPVTARLIAESTAIEPGGSAWLGIQLDQEAGWHTYWKNSGDAGFPTTVEWDLPEGFSVSDIVWPAPHRYVEPGDLVTFGYSGRHVLLVELTAPASASGTVTIRGTADWLMCKTLCIPGSAALELTLAVGAPTGEIPEADAALFAAARARLPQSSLDGVEIESALELSPVPAGQRMHAALAIDGVPVDAEWNWFPYGHTEMILEAATSRRDGDRLLIAQPLTLLSGMEAGAEFAWGGVLEIHEDGAEPRFLDVSVALPVAAATATPSADSSGLVAAALGTESAAAPASGNLFYYLLLALVGGVILNVMPCVLPVLSLKVMSFVHHAGEDRGVQFRLGLMFTAGVLASFLALALVVIALQSAGELIGWGFQFQNPGFVVIMSAIVFAFGLSLFGVYEIILPVQIGGGGSHGRYGESFLNGILATALATPCTAPLLGSALGFAFSQPAAVILAIFLTTGLGLSLPYLLLSLNPGWLRFVPRPGAWMDRFKQAMGFLLMATLIWLLWVLGQQVGLDALASVMAFLLLVGFALWLYGSMLTLSSSTARRTTVWIIVLALIAGGWWQFVGDRVSSEAVAENAQVASHGDWIPFSEETLAAEVSGGNTVFIDFTAAWCMTCKVNEKTVINTDEVQEVFAELGVVKLLGDWTNRDETITRMLRRHGRSGVPFYAVFPAGKLDDPIVLPEVITRSLVIEALREAGPSATVASR